MITATMDNKDSEMSELREQIKVMEKRLAGSLKGLLLWSGEKELAASHKVSLTVEILWWSSSVFSPIEIACT